MTLVPGQDSDVDSNTYSQLSTDSGHSASTRGHVSSRRSRGHYSIVRPGVPPPAPPTRPNLTDTDTSEQSEDVNDSDNSMTSSQSNNDDSLLICDSLKVKSIEYKG